MAESSFPFLFFLCHPDQYKFLNYFYFLWSGRDDTKKKGKERKQWILKHWAAYFFFIFVFLPVAAHAWRIHWPVSYNFHLSKSGTYKFLTISMFLWVVPDLERKIIKRTGEWLALNLRLQSLIIYIYWPVLYKKERKRK